MTLQDVQTEAQKTAWEMHRLENYCLWQLFETSTVERDEHRYEYYEQFAEENDIDINTAFALLRNLQTKPFWKIKQHARIVDRR